MLNAMPLNLIKEHKCMDNVNLDKFFGFIECIVTTPPNIKIGILPVKHEGKTIFPKGTWKGTYFSQEIKECIKHGYRFKFIKGYEYSKCNLFNNYVNHFYNIKKNSSGSERFIAKLSLNTLYGYFGRKLDLIETVNIHIDELEKYSVTRVIKNIMQIDDNYVTLLLNSNINTDILSAVNRDIGSLEFKSNHFSHIKSNVAIASAVTAYGRIHMIPFKLSGVLFYTDTDSIITATILDDSLLGKEIGLMKDELNGLPIKEAYFLGIKKYGYFYIDREGNRTSI
jgi:DNA polymerase type B, organellar and viral